MDSQILPRAGYLADFALLVVRPELLLGQAVSEYLEDRRAEIQIGKQLLDAALQPLPVVNLVGGGGNRVVLPAEALAELSASIQQRPGRDGAFQRKLQALDDLEIVARRGLDLQGLDGG